MAARGRTVSGCSQEDESSDESITDLTEQHDSGGYDHKHSRRSPWPVHALGNVTVKQGPRSLTCTLHQVKDLAPGKLKSVGLLLDGKCKVCTSARCLHTCEFRKTCYNARTDASELVHGVHPSFSTPVIHNLFRNFLQFLLHLLTYLDVLVRGQRQRESERESNTERYQEKSLAVPVEFISPPHSLVNVSGISL